MASNLEVPGPKLQFEKPAQKEKRLHTMLLQEISVTDIAFLSAARNIPPGPEALEASGYTQEQITPCKLLAIYHEMCKSLSIDIRCTSEGGENFQIEAWHSPISAVFSSVLNARAGLIVAYHNISPSQSIPDRPQSALPELLHCSDVVYCQWLTQNLKLDLGPHKLRYVLCANIVNVYTLAVIEAILDARRLLRETYPVWPGITIDMDSEEGKALLGTPNGSGVAWLLVQHKAECQLGHKTVIKVSLFYNDA
jgi:hypothetical protein